MAAINRTPRGPCYDGSMHSVDILWLQFALCAGLIGIAGAQLSIYGDVIARRTGLSGSWIGLALLATVTSLPELATGITSVTIANAPNLAVGDALGSCVVNLVFLVVIDLFFRKGPIWQVASKGHVLAGAFGIVMLGLTLTTLQMGQLKSGSATGVGEVSYVVFNLATPMLLALYLVAMRTVFAFEKRNAVEQQKSASGQLPSKKKALVMFSLAGATVMGAGIWLPFVSSQLAASMGWNNSFMGSLFVALVTSAPELAVTTAALRIGAVNMAIGNLLGSNLFNVAIIAIDDLLYAPGSLFTAISSVHAVTASSAISMTGLALIGLFFKPQSRVFHLTGWVSIGLLALYLLNTVVVYLYGE